MKTLWVSPLWKNFFKCILSKNVEIGLEASILPEKSNEFLHTNFNISHQMVSREFCPSFDGNMCWTKKDTSWGTHFFRSKSEIVTTDFVHDATTTHVGRTSDECWLLQQSTGRCFHHIRRERWVPHGPAEPCRRRSRLIHTLTYVISKWVYTKTVIRWQCKKG